MNEILLIVEVILSDLMLLFLYKKYKFDVIYIFSTILMIFSSILSSNVIEIFNLDINISLVFNILIFNISSIIVQRKGPDEVKKLLTTLIYSSVIIYSLSVLSIYISNSTNNELTNNAYNIVLNLNNRMFFANTISLFISIYINSKLYHQIRQIKNKIWISNILSLIIIMFIEGFIFSFIAYLFKISILNVIEVFVIRYIFNVLIGIANSTCIYKMNND